MNKKLLFFISVSLFWGCIPDSLSTNTTEVEFSGTLTQITLLGGSDEEVAREIIPLRKGGLAMVGSTKSTDGDFSERTTNDWDLFLIKLDHDGEILWKKTYGGSGDDFGFSIVETPEGGFVLLGYSNSQDGDVPPTQGYHDNWIIKIDADGAIVWKKSFGYSGHDHSYNVIATQEGGYFFNGFLDVTASNGLGNSGKSSKANRHGVGEFWCHKLDANGNIEWQRYFGGTSNDRSYDAIQTREGNFLVVGTSESDDVDVKNPKGSYDVWTVMVSPSGEMLWENSFGGSLVDEASKVIQDAYGHFRIIGNTHSSDQNISLSKGGSDVWQITLDPNGRLVGSYNFGGSEFDKGTAMSEWQWGSIFLTGYSRSSDGDFEKNEGENDIFLMYFPSNGTQKKTMTLGGEGEDFAHDILVQTDGSVFLVGQSFSKNPPFETNKGNGDILLARWN
ncbi:MAG: hypothetical protein GWP29_03635 [Bacteroidetes bacterium]|nr:hypothetical protein [Flavobacteriaceae bacterium]MDG1940981.1 hypothetical protein [Flavobacteriaceae bacterium]NCF30962.1 hypothetical protein [Bacteroidota bacterium]